MNLSSGYIVGKGISPGVVPPKPYPFYWWRSPGVCPIREVNGYRPSIGYDSRYPSYHEQNYMCTIDTSNKYYDGGDIGCDALEITDDLPWGYDESEHDYTPYRMTYYIPLYDSNGQESTRYKIIYEILIYDLLPYVDQNNEGYYFVTAQMILYDFEEQDWVLAKFIDAEGVFKPSGNHFYMYAGADTFYWHERWTSTDIQGSISDYIYSGLIIDACHYYGYSRVKWSGVAFSLTWIEENLGLHLDPRWI